MSDSIWSELFESSLFFEEIYSFLSENPKQNSAELNSFLKYCEHRGARPQNCEIYLSGTKTSSNEIAICSIERYFKEKLECEILTSFQFPGYFERPIDIALYEFTKGLTELLDKFIYIASKKKKDGYKVIFNPTGGFKAHVITCALAGFLTGCEVYYIHEEFKDLIIFPPLFYIPRGKELKILKELSDKKTLSKEQLLKDFTEEIDRLQLYGMIEVSEEPFKFKLTNRGLWAYNYLNEVLKGKKEDIENE